MNSIQSNITELRRTLTLSQIAELIGSNHHSQVSRMLKTGVACASTERLLKIICSYVASDKLDEYVTIIS